ncbi:unnamed protein product [Amoebophrya sp. A25]|nr:unnamed protein product [Amoebophrya sp. A25]|eukprot:GSA25T00022503001.1
MDAASSSQRSSATISEGKTLREWLTDASDSGGFLLALNPSFLGFFSQIGSCGALDAVGLLKGLRGACGSSAGAMSAGYLATRKPVFVLRKNRKKGIAKDVEKLHKVGTRHQLRLFASPTSKEQDEDEDDATSSSTSNEQDNEVYDVVVPTDGAHQHSSMILVPAALTAKGKREDQLRSDGKGSEEQGSSCLVLDSEFSAVLHSVQSRRHDVLDFGLGLGALKGQGFATMMSQVLQPFHSFADLPVPFGCVAYDFVHRDAVIMTEDDAVGVGQSSASGTSSTSPSISRTFSMSTSSSSRSFSSTEERRSPLAAAIVASGTVPALFHPAKFGDRRFLLDGALAGDSDGCMALKKLHRKIKEDSPTTTEKIKSDTSSTRTSAEKRKNDTTTNSCASSSTSSSSPPTTLLVRVITDRTAFVGARALLSVTAAKAGIFGERGRSQQQQQVETGNKEEQTPQKPRDLDRSKLPEGIRDVLTIVLKNAPDLWLGAESFMLLEQAILWAGRAVIGALHTVAEEIEPNHYEVCVDIGWDRKQALHMAALKAAAGDREIS